ncbi:hypothetical protein [Methylobacterium sp. WL64]|uniref:hypothetical protein n=1 Tax=Methylobacterium sp. WL64 TaxID=2603894 RepID=UPI0016502B0D|nr:hypothetical protein [Methylobacterium sp. WL64]
MTFSANDRPADVAARRAAERDRRIAKGRAEAEGAPLAIALADTGGNGGPPSLSPLQEFSAIAELLYGDRWTTDVARDLGHGDGRTVRRWKSGQAQVAPGDLAHLRRIARKRAAAITRLVGDRLDEPAKPKRDSDEIRARFEATIAASRAAQG